MPYVAVNQSVCSAGEKKGSHAWGPVILAQSKKVTANPAGVAAPLVREGVPVASVALILCQARYLQPGLGMMLTVT